MQCCSRILVLLVILATAVLPAASKDDPTKPIIAVELKAAPGVKKGQRPKFVVEVVNTSDKEITLVKPGDGSDCGWRTPVIAWAVEGVRPTRLARCGNINALKADEVFALKPGQRAPLGDWVGFPTLPGPGKYKVRFRYENKPGQKWMGEPLGRHDAAAMARVRGSTPAAAESNVVEVELKE
jgi:hypothetical protein